MRFAGRATMLGIGAGIALLVTGQVAGAASTATVQNLSFSEFFADGSGAAGVNSSGMVYGYGQVFTGYQISWSGKIPLPTGLAAQHTTKAVTWTGTSPTDLTPSGATSAVLVGVSDDGTAVGEAQIGTTSVSFIHQGTKSYQLAAGFTAYAVSRNGLVLVVSGGLTSTVVSVWKTGTLTTVATLSGAYQTGAIDSSGRVAVSTSSGTWLISGGSTAALPAPSGMTSVRVVAMNDNGRVLAVAYGTTAAGSLTGEGVVWNGVATAGAWSGSVVLLSGKAGASAPLPTAINASGAVVGNDGANPSEWSSSGVLTELSTDGGTAYGISDTGIAVGQHDTAAFANFQGEPAMWTGTTLVNLTGGSSGTFRASGIDDTGKYIAGSSAGKAARWTISTS